MTSTNVSNEKIIEIREEKQKMGRVKVTDVLDLIKQGKLLEARQNLIFHTEPLLFTKKTNIIVGCLDRDFNETSLEIKRNFLIFLTNLTLDLSSFLPEWNLKNKELHCGATLSETDIENCVLRNKKIISSWGDREKALVKSLLKKWSDETTIRFKVEGTDNDSEARKQATEFIGDSILGYINNMETSMKKSNTRRICELMMAGQIQTEIGNDHTTNLEYAMWLGASFVTTNPQLIELTWELYPEVWTPKIDKMIGTRYSHQKLNNLIRKSHQKQIEKTIEEICTAITMEIVFDNAKMLRGIFLLTEGQKGLVCLQVNPLKHSDANAMIREALSLYSKLTDKFGGIPNVVFKLPATKAGLEATKELTNLGIGVTITVSFGMFQALPFIDIINKGKAIVSYLVIMNGRLANPVMDELKEFGSNFAKTGRWAGVAVAKRLYQELYGVNGGKRVRGNNFEKIKVVVASLRNYEDSFPDITEMIGVSVITVFPNIRRAFDAKTRKIYSKRISKVVNDKVLRVLLKSEVFKQAYFEPDDDELIKPRLPFFLEDEEKVLQYPPVEKTLGQFCEYRIKLKKLVEDRILTLAQP